MASPSRGRTLPTPPPSSLPPAPPPPTNLDLIRRLARSFPYWAERLVTILDEKRTPVPFRLNAVQRRVYRYEAVIRERGYRKALVLKARRTGITTYMQARALHDCWRKSNTLCRTFAHTDEASTAIFRDVLLFMSENIPDDFKPHANRENSRMVSYDRLRSRVICATARGKAPGRGETLSRTHVSEAAHVEADKLAALRAGLMPAVRAGEGMYVEESTGNGCAGPFYQACMEVVSSHETVPGCPGLMLGRNEWALIFLPWFLDEHNTRDPKLDGPEPVVSGVSRDGRDAYQDVEGEEGLVELALSQYGMAITPGQLAWRRWMKRSDTDGVFAQEYPETPLDAFLANAAVFFDAKSVRAALMTVKPPIRVEDNGRLLVWQDPEVVKPDPKVAASGRPVKTTRYIAVADTAEGVAGGDPSYLSIIRHDTAEQVLSWHGVITPADFARVCCRLAGQYNNAVLAFERNNHGHAAIVVAYEQIRYRSLYYDETMRVGWVTDGKTRPIMLDALKEAVDAPRDVAILADADRAAVVKLTEAAGGDVTAALEAFKAKRATRPSHGWLRYHDPRFYAQCLTFQRDGTGKYAAAPGAHDDCVMTAAIGLQVRARYVVPGVVKM